jgi:HK97 family phage portal protein
MLNNLFEKRAITFQKLFEMGEPIPSGTRSGVTISENNSLTIAPVYAAIRLISDVISTLPVDTFYRFDGERRPYRPKPRWVDNPEPDKSYQRVDHYQTLLVSLLVDGNSFTRKIYNAQGEIVALTVLDPQRVIVRRNSFGRIEFSVDNGKFILSEDEVIHITEMRKPGALRGVSRINELRETLGLTKALELFSAQFFGGGSSTQGVIEVPYELTKEQAGALQDGWEQGHKGWRKAHRPGILSGGAKFMKTSVDPEEAQMLESRRFSLEEICRIFRIPPFLLQSTEPGSMSYASAEENNRAFISYTLLPYIAKIETAYSTMLPGEAFLKINVDGLLRANLTERYAAYSTGIQSGFLSINDVHRLEDMRAVDGGEVYRVPLANVSLDAANIAEMDKRILMAQRLIVVGFAPEAVLTAMNLPAIPHTGLPSVQLQQAAQFEPENPEEAYPLRSLDFENMGDGIIDAIRNMAAPVVNVEPPVVNVTLPEVKPVTRSVQRDDDGNIIKIVEE